MSNKNAVFTVPTHPGLYPITISDDTKIRAGQGAEHKGSLFEHEICAGVMQVMNNFIEEAVDEEWLGKIEYDVMGFTDVSPLKMLERLEERSGTLDYVDTI